MSYLGSREDAKKDCAAATSDPPGWGTTSPVLNGAEDGGGMKASKGNSTELTQQHWSFTNQGKKKGMDS
jgi:hypothetical protein